MAGGFDEFPEAGSAISPASSGDFADFPEAAGETDGALSTVGEQAVRGGLESVGVVGGAMTGARIGGLAAPVLGPLAPLGPVIGGVAGAAYGAFAGSQAAEGLRIPSVEQLPEALRPFGYAGQSLGGALSFAAAPYTAAVSGFRFGQSMVGNYLNQIIETAKRSPILFGLGEATSAASAAVAAGGAEAVAPGQPGIRVTSEMLGGALNPTRLVFDSATWAWSKGKEITSAFSPAARETAAGRMLTDIFSVTGEDPSQIAQVLRSLENSGVPGTENLTGAQKTGSMGLAALEDWLAKESDKFGADSAQRARDGMDAVRGQIALLTRTGDPAALQAAAEIQSAYFRSLIQARLDSATNTATAAASKITKDTPAARAELGIVARNAVEESISAARKAESDLWSQVDETRKVGVSNLQKTYNEIRTNLLPEVRNQKTPAIVRDFLERTSKSIADQQSPILLPENLSIRTTSEPVGTSVKEMRQLRSELLDLSRSATNAGEYGQARIYSDLAESVLDDMDAAFAQTGDTTYDAARAFSRELNDTFTRSFAGRVMGQGRYGDRIAPELTLRKALSSGKEAGAIQMQELEEATRFMVTRGLGDDTSMRNMLDAQERILRLAAADSIDVETGKVNTKSLQKFINDNEILMNRFPEVKRDLGEAVTSEQSRKRMESLAKGQMDIVEKQKTFSKIADGDGLTLANKALISLDQERDFGNMLKVAKSGGKDAMDGLKASIFEAAITKSTNNQGVLDVATMRSFLFDPTVPGKKSLMQMMQESGAIDRNQLNNINKLFDAAESISRAGRPGTAVDITTDIGDTALATISRMVGSTVAGGAARAAGSQTPSLVVHGAGARLAETAMTKLPGTTVRRVLMDAMVNDDKLIMLLEKADTPAKQAEQARRIHAWLVQSGLTGAEQAAEEYLPSLPEVVVTPETSGQLMGTGE